MVVHSAQKNLTSSHLFKKKKKKEVEMLLKAPTLQASIIHALIHGIWHDT